MKIRFVYYIAKFDIINVLRRKRKLHLLDDGISLWTGLFNWWTPPYSHMSVWVADDLGWLELKSKETGSVQIFEKCVGIHKPDANTSETYGAYEYAGTCYTSTMRGDENGTVSRPATGVFKYPERWEYIEFEVTDESFGRAKAWADMRVANNQGYSLKDIRRFFMPLWLLKKLKWDDPEREICSEHGEVWAIRLIRHVQSVSHIDSWLLMNILIRSPRRLWRDLVRRHHVKTYSLATGKVVRDEKGKKVKA